MDHRLAIPLLIATLILFSARSRADETQRESHGAHALSCALSVAVAVDPGKIALAAR